MPDTRGDIGVPGAPATGATSGPPELGDDAHSPDATPTAPTSPWKPEFSVAQPLERVGRYRVVRLLAAGGMGVVYEAVQDQPHRTVALKVIRPGMTDEAALRRFENESQVLARLGHACIAQVYEAGVHNPSGADASLALPYFAMEYVPGARTITEFAKERELSLNQRLALFSCVCDAVDHAHRNGVIHRDLKPSNILVPSDTGPWPEGRSRAPGAPSPKVIDFGIARAVDARGASMHTAASSLIGTPEYMSPEQCGGGAAAIDARSDVYALGVVLFELLTGELPYPVRSVETSRIPGVILTQPPTRASRINPALAGDVERVIAACLRKEPEQRYPSAGALKADIDRIVAGEPIGPDPSGSARKAYFLGRRFVTHYPAVVLACALLVAVVAAWMFPWVDLERRFDGLVTGALPSPSLGPAMRHVRIITITDQTDPEALAAESGIEGVSTIDMSTFRALHARLLDRLAASGCTVVAFDMWMRKPARFDDRLAAAARNLRSAAKIDTIIGAFDWNLDDRGLPVIAPIIAREVRWGVTTSGWRTDQLYRVDFLARPRGEPVMPSLALATLASHWAPGADVFLTLGEREVEVHHAEPGDGPVASRARRAPSDTIALTMLEPYRLEESPNEDHVGLTPEHVVGFVLIPMPDDPYFTSGTVEYADVLRADDARLRELFAGKIVLVANTRAGIDMHASPSGRLIPGVWAHAAAIEAVLMNRVRRVPSDRWAFVAVAVAGAFGTLAGARYARRLRAALAAILCFVVAAVAGSAVSYSIFGMVWNPLPACAAVALGGLLGGLLMRLRPAPARGGLLAPA